MKDRKLATRYARALFAALPDAHIAETADEFLKALSDAMARSPEFRDVLMNPSVSRAARKRVLSRLADQHRVAPAIKNFLCVVADNGRTGNLPSISAVFHQVREEQAGIVPVQMDTAHPLPQELLDRARASLERLTGKRVRMEIAVRPSLIGGAIARVGSKVYDGSLRTQLNLLRRRMALE